MRLVAEYRAKTEEWYRRYGHREISIPMPAVTDDRFGDWARKEKGLFYRPATFELSYQSFMDSVDLGSNWTAHDAGLCEDIAWEPAERGYWFLLDTGRRPRAGRSGDDLNGSIRLSCLEEYVIARTAQMDWFRQRFDSGAVCWLRTRCGNNLLSVCNEGEFEGLDVDAGGGSDETFSLSGGRECTVVPNA